MLKSTERTIAKRFGVELGCRTAERGGCRLSRLALAGLLGQEHGVDVGEHTALGDGHVAEQLVELFVVSDGELQVSGHDSLLAVVSGSVAGQLEDLGAQVLEHSGQVHGGTTADSVGEPTESQVSANSADGERETSSRASGLGLALAASAALAFTFSGHDERVGE